ncbi:MAG: hypothetical protein R3F60_24455 [bacterium]
MRVGAYWWLVAVLWGLAACDSGGGGSDPTPDMGGGPGIEDLGPPEADAAPPEADQGVEPMADAAPPLPDAGDELQDLSLNSVIPNRGLTTGGTAVGSIGTGFAAGTGSPSAACLHRDRRRGPRTSCAAWRPPAPAWPGPTDPTRRARP